MLHPAEVARHRRARSFDRRRACRLALLDGHRLLSMEVRHAQQCGYQRDHEICGAEGEGGRGVRCGETVRVGACGEFHDSAVHGAHINQHWHIFTSLYYGMRTAQTVA